MSSTNDLIRVAPDMAAHGGVLTPTIRRDLADLNRQYLELALAPELSIDPRFAWSDIVRSRLAATDASTRARMAGCPFALFEIQLPSDHCPMARPAPLRVEEGGAMVAAGEPWRARCLEFAQFALFLALRLTDAAPLATRIALGLSPVAELRLHEMCPSEVAQFAARPDVVRPRWPAHPRFWAMLQSAARPQRVPPAWRQDRRSLSGRVRHITLRSRRRSPNSPCKPFRCASSARPMAPECTR